MRRSADGQVGRVEGQRVVTESDAAHPARRTEPATATAAASVTTRRTWSDPESLTEPLLLRSGLSGRRVARRSGGRGLTGRDSLERRVRRD